MGSEVAVSARCSALLSQFILGPFPMVAVGSLTAAVVTWLVTTHSPLTVGKVLPQLLLTHVNYTIGDVGYRCSPIIKLDSEGVPLVQLLSKHNAMLHKTNVLNCMCIVYS